MEIRRLKLSKRKLADLPERERTLLLLLGHANNEINVFSKLILMIRKDDPPSQTINHVEAGQTFIILRTLVGKLHEAWELFRVRVQADRQIAAKYVPQLGAEGVAALDTLKKHFGQSSPLTAIRNKLSFHYTDKDNLTEINFQQLPDTEPWDFYLTKSIGNTFYLASELVMSLSAINLTKDKDNTGAPIGFDDREAFAKLCDVVIVVSRKLTELFGHLMSAIIETIPDLEWEIEQLPNGPKLSEFCLPYFFYEDDHL